MTRTTGALALGCVFVFSAALSACSGEAGKDREVGASPEAASAAESQEPGPTAGDALAGPPGTDEDLDSLWEECAAGELLACDAFYSASPYRSQYFRFATTCGYTAGYHGGTCGSEDPFVRGETYGDDPAKDALWDACGAGDAAACTELKIASDTDSGDNSWATTCGNTTDGTGEYRGCVE